MVRNSHNIQFTKTAKSSHNVLGLEDFKVLSHDRKEVYA